MRSLGILFAALTLAVPTAVAAPGATVTISGPATVDVAGPTTVQVKVGLELSDFHCFHDQEFHVGIALNATGVAAAMDSYVATFTVPEGSYAFDHWSGEAELPLHLTATDASSGQVDLVATFASDGGRCLAPGGFPEATATLTIQTTSSAAPPAPEPTPQPTPTPTPTSEPTPATPSGPTPPTPSSPANATNATPPSESVDQLPPGGGYIGDYNANGANSTPGASVALVVAGTAGVATLMRRRR